MVTYTDSVVLGEGPGNNYKIRHNAETDRVVIKHLDTGEEVIIGPGSIDTERLSNTVHYLDSSKTVADIQNKIEELTTENGGDGGIISLEPQATYTVTAETRGIWMKSDVTLDLNGATVTLADGVNDGYPYNGLINFDNDTLTTNAHVRNGELDGNLANNSSFTDRKHRQGINLHYIKIDDSGTPVAGVRPERCSIENIYSHDTIASNAVVSGRDCSARNLWLSDTGNDHWLYMPSAIDCSVENVWCSGAARSEGITIGSFNDGEDYYGNTIETVRIRNVSYTPVSGNNLEWLISVRDANTGNGIAKNNAIRDVVIDVDDTTASSKTRIHAPTIVKDFVWTGGMSTDEGGIINVSPGASGSRFDGVSITLESGDGSGSALPFIRDDGASNVTYSDLTFVNNAGQNARAFFVTGLNAASENVIITDYHIEDINNAFRIAGENLGVREMTIGHGTAIVGSNVYDLSGSPTFADGSMVPQDVRNITNTYRGRTGYHDGSGTNTEGPAHYTSGGSWVSDVDGTTIV